MNAQLLAAALVSPRVAAGERRDGEARVQVTVYRTRQRGIRLPAPAAGVRGELTLELWRLRYARQLAARLTRADDASLLLLPELLAARVERITRGGIVIAGTEIVPRRGTAKSSADRYPQTWWCLVHSPQPGGPAPGTT